MRCNFAKATPSTKKDNVQIVCHFENDEERMTFDKFLELYEDKKLDFVIHGYGGTDISDNGYDNFNFGFRKKIK